MVTPRSSCEKIAADLIGLGADDLYLGAGGAQHEHLVQHDRVDNGHHHAVQDCRTGLNAACAARMIKSKTIMVLDTGRWNHLFSTSGGDIHAAGGSTSADGDAQRDADAQTRKYGVQHQIIGQYKIAQQPLPQCQKKGLSTVLAMVFRAKRRPSTTSPASSSMATLTTNNTADTGRSGDLVESQCNTGGTAGDQAGGHQK